MRTILFSLAVCIPILLAESPKAPARAASGPSDPQIEAAIKARFSASKISRNNFQVSVRGGVATLTGNTDVVQHKGVATRLARSGGAKTVVNQIRVSEAARQKAGQHLARARKAVVKRSDQP